MSIKKLLTFIFLLLLIPSYGTSGSRPFSERFMIETRGNFEYIGNTMLVCQSGCSSDAHNYATLGYADVDGDASTFNSSSANLSLPTGATVEWAGLYWSGTVDISRFRWSGITNAPNQSIRGTVKFKLPGSSSYLDINASVVDTIAEAPVAGWEAYQAFSDVTSLVKTAGDGDYTLANLQVDRGGGHPNTSFTGPYGGWNLVVVYSIDNEKLRRFNIWDGYDFIYFSSADKTFPVDNIRTPPSGNYEAELAFSCYDGERVNLNGGGYNGDFVSINHSANKLYDGLNTSLNICNGTISKHGSHVTSRNPSDTNTWGYDLDRMSISSSSYIGNNASSLDIIFGSSNEGIWFGNLVFSTEIFPKLVVEKAVVGNPAPNDWSFTLSSNNCSLPSGLPNPVSVSGAGGFATFSNLSVDQGGVQCEYSVQENNQAGYAMNTSLSDTLTGITLSQNEITRVRVTNEAQTLSDLTNCFSIVSADQTENDTVDNRQCVTLASSVNSGNDMPVPVADYRFDECSWNNVNNEVINATNNRLHGRGYQGATTSSGKLARAGVFDGSNDYVRVENHSDLQIDRDLTLSLWIKPDNLSGDQTFIYKHFRNEYELLLRSNGRLRFRHGDGSSYEYRNLDSTNIIPGIWTHITLVRNHADRTIKWFINGVLVETDTYTRTPSTSNSYVRLGRRGNNQAVDGQMDEVKIFNVALSDTQAQLIYANENFGKNYNGTDRSPVSCSSSLSPRSTASSSVTPTETGALVWRSVWINNGISDAPYVEISAEIPEGSRFIESTENGTAPVGLFCEARGASVTDNACYYEAPSEDYPFGRIRWAGVIAPESSASSTEHSSSMRNGRSLSTLESSVNNEVVIEFVTYPTGERSVLSGQAYADWYFDGSNDGTPDARTAATEPLSDSADEPVPSSIEIDVSNYNALRAIPTVGEWSLIILSILMSITGLLLHRRRED